MTRKEVERNLAIAKGIRERMRSEVGRRWADRLVRRWEQELEALSAIREMS